MSGRPCTLAAEMAAVARHARKVIRETRSILLPVLLCIMLTQVAWVAVYDCTVTKNIFLFGGGNTFGSDWWDGVANAASAMAVIGFVSAVMITLAIYRFKRIVEAWLALSCIVVSLLITGTLFQDGVARLPIDDASRFAITSALTAVYGGGAALAFFTKHMPTWFSQLYKITNCAAIAVFYLNCMPGLTAWFLLTIVVVWDIFAVLAPMGPLKLALDLSQEYGADTLRFMMFTASSEEKAKTTVAESEPTVADKSSANKNEVEVDESKIEERPHPSRRLGAGADTPSVFRPAKRLAAGSDNGGDLFDMMSALLAKAEAERVDAIEESDDEEESEESDDGFSSGDSSSEGEATSSDDQNNNKKESNNNNKKDNNGVERNAREALDSGSHLGFGDFIFYSILVGKSLAVGFVPALVTTFGVMVGLAWTLTIGEESLPALPISIVFGMIGHFLTLANTAALEYLYRTYAAV